MKKSRLFLTMFVMLSYAFLTSCGGSSSSNPIEGNWKVVKTDEASSALNMGIEYNFEDAENLTVGSGIMKAKYKYTVSGDTLNMDYNGTGDMILTWIISIDGNKMTMKNTTATQEFVLEK